MKVAACLLFCGLLAQADSPTAEVIFNRAVEALARRDYSAAEQEFLAVLAKKPDNVGAIANLGILYARTDRVDKAIAEYDKALRLSPNDEPILLNLGLVYLKEELYSRALTYFDRVLALDPPNRQARQLRDLCLLYTGEILRALHDLEALNQDTPRDSQLLFLLGFAHLKNGDSKTALAIFNQMFETAGPAQAQFLLGKASYDAALFSQAEDSFLQVLQLDPKFPGIHLGLGKVYISERRNADAIEQLQAALKENPNDEEANYFLGSLLVRENQFSQGLEYLERAIKLKPDSYGAYLYLGKAQLHLGRISEAISLLKKAVELNPDDANAEYTLGRALKSSGQEAAAKQAFERVHSLHDRAVNDTVIPGVR